jgi:hypothetical protein
VIKVVLNGDTIFIGDKEMTVIDVGADYIVVRDENYNTVQIGR